MNLPSLLPIKHQLVQKYLPHALELVLTSKITNHEALSKEEKVVVTKIYKNLNLICKLNLKELKEVIKIQPAYQQVLADIYFEKKLNNYFLITSAQKPSEARKHPILQIDRRQNSNEIVGFEYRIQFTLSNILKKNMMKPLILMVFLLKNGRKESVYLNMQQFTQFRRQVATSMRQIFGVELRLL